MKFLVCLVPLLFVSSSCASSLPEDTRLLLAIRHDTKKVADLYKQGAFERNLVKISYPGLDDFDVSGNLSHLVPSSPDSVGVQFFLYNRNNPKTPVGMRYNEDPQKFISKMSSSGKLAIICHGFGGSASNIPWGNNIKDGLLKLDDLDVIILDWGKGATAPNYQRAAGNTRMAARITAHFVANLVQNTKLTPERVHFIGFSLGGQVASFFGQDYQHYHGKKIGRLTGLDPAAPLFEEYNVHIRKSDGIYVDVMHTSAGNNILAGKLGMSVPGGHVDYYPNGGSKQPSCGLIDVSCSHTSAHTYFTQSIQACKYQSYPCSGGWKDFQAGKCKSCDQNSCSRMGHFSNSNTLAKGKLYLTTSGSSPYC